MAQAVTLRATALFCSYAQRYGYQLLCDAHTVVEFRGITTKEILSKTQWAIYSLIQKSWGKG